MLYNAEHDLYEVLAVSALAPAEDIRAMIDALRGAADEACLDEAAAVLLNLDSRTRYDAERATHRMRLMMRDGLGVFSGRTPAWGVPTMGLPDDD
jgi:hypothetical protein